MQAREACDNGSMIRIDIRPVWRFRRKTERDFDFMLIALLEAIEHTGKLTQVRGTGRASPTAMRGT